MLKVYLATPNDKLTALRDHVVTHGSPPPVEGMDSIVGVVDTPGLARLEATENPEYYEACLKNMFDMIIEVNARARTQGLGTADTMRIYDETQPGGNYADTSVKEDNAWTLRLKVFSAEASVHRSPRPTMTGWSFCSGSVGSTRDTTKRRAS